MRPAADERTVEGLICVAREAFAPLRIKGPFRKCLSLRAGCLPRGPDAGGQRLSISPPQNRFNHARMPLFFVIQVEAWLICITINTSLARLGDCGNGVGSER